MMNLRFLTSTSRAIVAQRRLFSGTAKSLPASFQLALASPTGLNLPNLPLTKIVATIGPASENLPVIYSVIDSGVNIMRINFSHATYEEALLRITNLNSYRNAIDGKEGNMRAIMLDTQGPEIRTGSFANGVKEVDLVAGQELVLTIDEQQQKQQTPDKIWISYQSLVKTVKAGDIILLDDGAVAIQVQGMATTTDSRSHHEIVTKVMNNGTLGNKKGVNMPGLVVDLPALAAKDYADLAWGLHHGIDIIAASFIRCAEDVHTIRSFCRDYLQQHQITTIAVPLIVSKIESTQGLVNFAAILAASDGIMIARGDLGVEIPLAALAGVQESILTACKAAGKPCIIATQMLESMIKSPRPTRAEVIDVAQGAIARADAVMLSGESAKGRYPADAVATMQQILLYQEEVQRREGQQGQMVAPLSEEVDQEVQAMAQAAVVLAAARPKVKAIAMLSSAYTEGDLALASTFPQALAAQRSSLPVFVAVPSCVAGRRLQLLRGLYPLQLSSDLAVQREQLMERLQSLPRGLALVPGDEIVVVADKPCHRLEVVTI